MSKAGCQGSEATKPEPNGALYQCHRNHIIANTMCHVLLWLEYIFKARKQDQAFSKGLLLLKIR